MCPLIPTRFGALALALVVAVPAAGADPTGEQIYRKQCASCHGPAGEGSKVYKEPLVGDRNKESLAGVIRKTMPEDDPGTLSAAEADRVAGYVFDAFYSRAARDRNAPPRVELARLTVAQYRNALADLVASFRPGQKPDDKHGLRGEYFDARGFRNDKRLIDRTDPELNFDFGTDGPGPKFDPFQFCARWEGSVLAPETGTYEFVVRTEHAIRLWVNDNKQPLIDAWVKSGSDTEYHVPLFLLGGRTYPLRLEFSKAKQGVDDTKKLKEKPKVKASVALLWKPPGRGAEVIPARNLLPAKPAETFVVTAPFPPDDRSLGWEKATTVSKEWEQATVEAALETAGYVAAHLNELAGTKDGAADRAAKAKEFAARFAERAFRRPLSDDERRVFIERQFAATPDPELAVKRSVLLALQSPRFLYREAAGLPEAYAVAGRLAFALWDAPPDAELLAAAAAGKLASRDEVAKQAARMLADPRAKAKLREFFLTWLKVEKAPDLAKDPKRYPGFDPALASDLRASLELFLDDVLWSEASDFRRLLLDEEVYLNGRLAKFYGADLPADAPFKKVKIDGGKRAGVLTHPYLLSAFAYTGTSSPIHRGVFVARGILGVTLKPPQDAFTPLAEDLHPTLTTRERVALQTKSTMCQSCHGLINPLGFTLENFDAAGRFRDKDNAKPVDATGGYETRSGKHVKFAGPRELAAFLAGSEEVHTAFAEKLFHHLVKQPVRAYGPGRLDALRESFAASGFNMRKLAVEIAVVAALGPEKPPGKK
jgi:hypothetical protein